jgi:hypothetical protein
MYIIFACIFTIYTQIIRGTLALHFDTQEWYIIHCQTQCAFLLKCYFSERAR